jgi:competence protein ComEC
MAAISVGEANPFGHPSPDAIERILAEGTHLFRTDRDGAVTATTDGQTLNVRSFLACEPPCSDLSTFAVTPAETPAF